MTKKTRPSPQLHSFGPELLQALLKGSREPLVLNTTYRKAVVFRRRLHELRATMRAAKHDLTHIVERATITLEFGERAGLPKCEERMSSRNVRYPRDPEVPAVLTIRPHDSEFRDQLLAAGVKDSDLNEDPLLVPHEEPPKEAARPNTVPDRDIEDILDGYQPRK